MPAKKLFYFRKVFLPPEVVLEPMSIAESVLSAGKAAGDIFLYLESASKT